MRVRLVPVVVDADDHVERARVRDRCGDDHLAHAAFEVRRELVGRAEGAGALEDHVDAERVPRNLAGSGVTAEAEVGVVDLEHVAVAVAADIAVPAPVHGIEEQEVRGGSRVAGDLVDVHELQVRPVPRGPQRQPAHAAEAVDPDACPAHVEADRLSQAASSSTAPGTT